MMEQKKKYYTRQHTLKGTKKREIVSISFCFVIVQKLFF